MGDTGMGEPTPVATAIATTGPIAPTPSRSVATVVAPPGGSYTRRWLPECLVGHHHCSSRGPTSVTGDPQPHINTTTWSLGHHHHYTSSGHASIASAGPL